MLYVCMQMFLRDAKQAEVLLSQQDNFLSKEEVPVSIFCIFNHSNLSRPLKPHSYHETFCSTL